MSFRSQQLANQAGKRLMVGIKGPWPDKEEEDFLIQAQPAGVILFARNIAGIEETKKLIAHLRSICGPPFVIAVDQEGGPVARFVEGVIQTPSAMGLAAGHRPLLAGKISNLVAQDLLKIGVDLNLAPVADINVEPTNPGIGCRSFSDDPSIVASFVTSIIRSYHNGGVASCAKHFPGKGRATLDAHLSLPHLSRGMPEMFAEELVPFRHAIKAGCRFLMTTHIVVPWLSEKKPVTMVDYPLRSLVRTRMCFTGLLLTDDLEMGALASYGFETVVTKAAAAHDILLICADLNKQKLALEILRNGMMDGNISLVEGASTLKRIEDILSWTVNLGHKASYTADIPLLAADENDCESKHERELEYQVALDALTLLRDYNGLLPISGNCPVIITDFMALTKVEDIAGNGDYLEELLLESGITGPFLRVPPEPDEDDREKAVQLAESGEKCLIFTANAHLYPKASEMLKKIIKAQPNGVHIALRNPYDISVIPDSSTALCSFGFRKPSLKAIVDILAGREKARGIMPVNL